MIIYFTDGATITAFDTSTHEEVWTASPSQSFSANAVTVGYDGDLLVTTPSFGDHSGTSSIYRFDAQTGAESLVYSHTNDRNRPVAVDKDQIYNVSHSSLETRALDGSLIRTSNLGSSSSVIMRGTIDASSRVWVSWGSTVAKVRKDSSIAETVNIGNRNSFTVGADAVYSSNSSSNSRLFKYDENGNQEWSTGTFGTSSPLILLSEDLVFVMRGWGADLLQARSKADGSLVKDYGGVAVGGETTYFRAAYDAIRDRILITTEYHYGEIDVATGDVLYSMSMPRYSDLYVMPYDAQASGPDLTMDPPFAVSKSQTSITWSWTPIE